MQYKDLTDEQKASVIEAARSASERCFLCRMIVNGEHPIGGFGSATPLFPAAARKDHLVLHHGEVSNATTNMC